MRRSAILIIGIAVLCASASYAFDPDELNKITFKNATGAQIQMIFLSPSDSQEWGPDIVGADYHISDGNSVSYYVHYPDASFSFDIMATDANDNTYEIYDYQIKDSKSPTVTFAKKNKTSTTPDFDYVTVTVTNATDYEVDYLFVSPEDSEAWGADLLDSEDTLASGDSYSFVVPVESKVTYNVMAVDEDNDTYKFDVTLDPNKSKLKVSIEDSDLDTSE